MNAERHLFVGVDAAKIGSKRKGWVSIAIDDDGFVAAGFSETFEEILAAYPDPTVIAVDIPIGLCTDKARSADKAARSVLGARSSSVFTAPVRAVLDAPDYSSACKVSLDLRGKKISKQTWALVQRIREVDKHRAETRLHEVHPEVSFRVLADQPLAYSKKTWGGVAERRRLLESARTIVPAELGKAGGVGADDILDAAVAAWSARRIVRGGARSLPETPVEYDGGRAIVIRA